MKLHIRHTMHARGDTETGIDIQEYPNMSEKRHLAKRSLQWVAGNEPDRGQKGT